VLPSVCLLAWGVHCESMTSMYVLARKLNCNWTSDTAEYLNRIQSGPMRMGFNSQNQNRLYAFFSAPLDKRRPWSKIVWCIYTCCQRAQVPGFDFQQETFFNQHIKYLRIKCIKVLNFLLLPGSRLGEFAQVSSISQVRLKLDYCCVVHGSAQQSALDSLDHVQKLHICLEAFRTFTVINLHLKAGELILELRRQQRCLQYISKLPSNLCNPAVFRVGTGFRQTSI